MSDIPTDIMEMAREAYAASPVKVQGHREANALIGVIARAILAAQERATAAERERWRPIETAPRGQVPVDLWSETWGGRVTDCEWRDGKWWRYGIGYEEYEFDPTHWMPLPTPPSPSPSAGERGSVTSMITSPGPNAPDAAPR